MYPNPQDVLPLPPRPDIEHYRKRAKELVKACKSGDEHVLLAWVRGWVRDVVRFDPRSERFAPPDGPYASAIFVFAREQLGQDCALSKAQFVIGRAHGFPSWATFVHHIESLTTHTPISEFEQAADAIVRGDDDTLATLLSRNPRLVHERSSREHNASLLHYVSANGVENYRQNTPKNIVAITKQLLAAGAHVDAQADMYGGGATTLGLVVTSAHPRKAGVQIELAELLIAHGARVQPGLVRDCLANNCLDAAKHFAARLPLSLEEAAGIGSVDVMTALLDADAAPSLVEMTAAASMASWYGQVDAVELLLDQGLDPSTRDADGCTALHIAAYEGHAGLAALLLDRGAAVNARDDQYATTPLVWALTAWLHENRPAERYRPLVLGLAAAGADVDGESLEHDRVRADAELYAALSANVRSA